MPLFSRARSRSSEAVAAPAAGGGAGAAGAGLGGVAGRKATGPAATGHEYTTKDTSVVTVVSSPSMTASSSDEVGVAASAGAVVGMCLF